MRHVALLCGVVVLLGLSLLLQHLGQDLQRAGMPPGGPLGSAGIVANEVHTQAWHLQDMASVMGRQHCVVLLNPQDPCPTSQPTHTCTLALGSDGVGWGLGTRGGGSPGPQRECARRKCAVSVPEAGPGS